jgi:hypothetical protein
MDIVRALNDLMTRVDNWRKKDRNVHPNAAGENIEASKTIVFFPKTAQSVPITQETQTTQSVPINQSTQTTESVLTMSTYDPTTIGDTGGAGSAEAQAVAAGVDPQPQTGRKGRVRKNGGAPRVAIAKKKKEPRPPRNPFRRSETGKLQLKSLQMGKRVETMTPRVEALQERLDTMKSRLDFVSGKLKLVKEELSSREDMATGEIESTEMGADVLAEFTEMPLDDEIEQQ